MSGDGVSVQTNLVQLANVATSTARSPQATHGQTPAHEPADRRETAKLKRVNETDKSDRPHVDPDHRRDREQAKNHGDEADSPKEPEAGTTPAVDDAAPPSGVGGIFDRKA
jgi:hypothetical protein